MYTMTEKSITRILLLVAIVFAVSRVPNGLQAELPVTAFEATAFSEPAIAEVRIFAGNFAPRGWAFCHGQLLSINQNQALFSLIGTIYGGDGRTTFALPDLRGRSVVGVGQGPGFANVQVGAKLGSSSATVTINPTVATGGSGGQAAPPRPPARPNAMNKKLMTAARPDSRPSTTTTVTQPPSTQTIDLHQPSLGLNYIIALQGIFPSRN
jgi:microcystin-dependent protein